MKIKIEFDLPSTKKIDCKETNNAIRRLESYKEDYKDKIYGKLASKAITFIEALDDYGFEYHVETRNE